MANESGGGRAVPVLAVLGILFFLVTVAVLIRSGDSDVGTDVATGTAVTTPVVSPQVEAPPVEPQVDAPVGAVATGAGGTAGDSASLALPIVAVAAALTMLTAGGMVLRRRVA